MNGLRLVRTIWDWFRELGHANEPEQRSQRLLRDWLSAEQRAQYDKYRYFEVVGCHSGRRYRIRHGTGSNIVELDYYGHNLRLVLRTQRQSCIWRRHARAENRLGDW